MTEQTRQYPVILVGGGTGGHIYPLVAIGEELESRQIPFCFVGEKGGREEKVVSELNWQFKGIASGKWRRYLSVGGLVQNIVDLCKVVIGIIESMHILLKLGSRVVFSKGGHVALPMVLAAKLLGRTVITHESDVVMGLTNRIAARFASKVLVAFEPSLYPRADKRYVQVGIPIRRALRQAAQLAAPKKSRPLILFLAGIQGSVALNKLIRESLHEMIKFADIVHVTGEAELLMHRGIAKKLPIAKRAAYKPFSFLGRELAYYYQSADLIVSRSSATVIAEAALFASPLYLVPLPTSAGNHQLENARKLNEAGAAILRQQHELDKTQFLTDIAALMNDKDLRLNLGTRLHDYFQEKDAVSKTVELILAYEKS